MKTLRFSLLLMAVLGLFVSAYAQTAPTSQTPAQTTTQKANHKAKKYNSPVVVQNTEEFEQKIQRVSRPANQPVKMRPVPKK